MPNDQPPKALISLGAAHHYFLCSFGIAVAELLIIADPKNRKTLILGEEVKIA
ncbi:MAG: hypothetical protein ACREQ2_21500 [Candidatus Binatia bacterium]